MTKNYNVENCNKPSDIGIAVVDLDLSDIFPANFVCTLPKRLMVTSQNQSEFQKKFGEKSYQILINLLEKALETTDDPNFKEELEVRLKLINPKSKNLVICSICRKNFVAKMIEFSLQENCFSCKNKMLLSK
jgi:hypothetical protein